MDLRKLTLDPLLGSGIPCWSCWIPHQNTLDSTRTALDPPQQAGPELCRVTAGPPRGHRSPTGSPIPQDPAAPGGRRGSRGAPGHRRAAGGPLAEPPPPPCASSVTPKASPDPQTRPTCLQPPRPHAGLQRPVLPAVPPALCHPSTSVLSPCPVPPSPCPRHCIILSPLYHSVPHHVCSHVSVSPPSPCPPPAETCSLCCFSDLRTGGQAADFEKFQPDLNHPQTTAIPGAPLPPALSPRQGLLVPPTSLGAQTAGGGQGVSRGGFGGADTPHSCLCPV